MHAKPGEDMSRRQVTTETQVEDLQTIVQAQESDRSAPQVVLLDVHLPRPEIVFVDVESQHDENQPGIERGDTE